LFQLGEAYEQYIVLGIRTDRGWFFPNPEGTLALFQQLDGPHRILVEPTRIGIERGASPVLVFHYLSDAYASARATDDGSHEGEIRCTVAADGVPRCAGRQWDLGRTGKSAAPSLTTAAPSAGKPCKGRSECASGESCDFAPGCAPGTCVPDMACTDDWVPYCGCDGQTFHESGSCPSKPYSKRGPCDTPAPR
jgi:hypothetical protein